MKRQQIVAGNWKMNKTFVDGRDLAMAIIEGLNPTEVQVILCPPFIHLKSLGNMIKGVRNMSIGAQNCHHQKSGAYTGEIAPDMLRSVDVDYVILGHSERREYFGETDELLAKKIDLALASGLLPIFCCGEKLDVREAGNHKDLVAGQIATALFHLGAEAFGKIIIAYEPVWAIGTGRTASPEQAQEMHLHIRNQVKEKYGEEVAGRLSILYGGSVKPANAKELFAQPDVDGGLIGGASLNAEDFLSIVDSF